MPVKVLQVVTQMNRAGMESRIMDIYRHIDRSKVQFDFYSFRLEGGDFDSEIESLGGVIHHCAPLSLKRLIRSHNDFVEFLREHPEYKIVHAHMNAWCGILLRAAEKAGVAVRIAHSRTALDKTTLKNIAKNLIKFPVNKYATHRFAVSRKAGIWLYGEEAVKQGKVEIWPNAIDYQKFRYNPEVRQEMRKELGIENSFVLIHVGNHRFEKNHPFLLRVFAEIKKKDTSARLVLVGGGDWSKVRRQSEQMGVAGSVIFTGSRPDVDRLLQAGDVFVFPSLYEGLPGAVLEAQAAGLPCIISDSITEEVRIAPLVEQIPLAAGARKWAEKVIDYKNVERKDMEQFYLRSGFAIGDLVDKLTEFYLKVCESS